MFFFYIHVIPWNIHVWYLRMHVLLCLASSRWITSDSSFESVCLRSALILRKSERHIRLLMSTFSSRVIPYSYNGWRHVKRMALSPWTTLHLCLPCAHKVYLRNDDVCQVHGSYKQWPAILQVKCTKRKKEKNKKVQLQAYIVELRQQMSDGGSKHINVLNISTTLDTAGHTHCFN